MLLLNDLNEMVHFANHTEIAGSVLNLNNLRNLAKAKCEKSSLLVYRSTDAALDLLNFYCCHCLYSH